VYDVDMDEARAAISIPAEYESYFAKVKQVTSTQGAGMVFGSCPPNDFHSEQCHPADGCKRRNISPKC
jgi:hypothetical protein